MDIKTMLALWMLVASVALATAVFGIFASWQPIAIAIMTFIGILFMMVYAHDSRALCTQKLAQIMVALQRQKDQKEKEDIRIRDEDRR